MPTSYSVVLIAVAIGIMPVFWWLWFIARRDDLTIGNLNFLIKVFFCGVLVAIPASIAEVVVIEAETENQIIEVMQRIWFHQQTFFAVITFFSAGIVAFIEEAAKAIGIVIFLFRRRIETSNDGMMCGMVIGLAFAVTENGVYFASALQSENGLELWGIVLLRFLLSTSAHIIYSGIMGTFFAEAKITARNTGKIAYVTLGFLAPILIHSIFNAFLGSSCGWIIIAIIIAGFAFMWIKYILNEKKRGIRIR
ncbi:MAG: PrsW family intramembrane metalloprotease [Patescibacteria group bacterium]|nr:PrsW family intramembrane metalloprotease [Patescibacteria group bacterium]